MGLFFGADPFGGRGGNAGRGEFVGLGFEIPRGRENLQDFAREVLVVGKLPINVVAAGAVANGRKVDLFFMSGPTVVDGRVYLSDYQRTSGELINNPGKAVAWEGSERLALSRCAEALSATTQGYCPPTMIKAGGVDQLLIWHSDSLNSLNPKNGEVHWSLPLKPNNGMAVMAPRVFDNKMFASGIGRVGAMITLDPDKPEASYRWKGKPKTAVYCYNSTSLSRPMKPSDVPSFGARPHLLTKRFFCVTTRIWPVSIFPRNDGRSPASAVPVS